MKKIHNHYEGDSSIDSRYWAFEVVNSDWGTHAVVCYDKDTDTIVGELTGVGAGNWVSMSPLGNYVVLATSSSSGVRLYPKDMSSMIRNIPGSGGHVDFALASDNREVVVYYSSNYVKMGYLDTGEVINLYQYWDNVGDNNMGFHPSGNNYGTPGWVLISHYGANQTADAWTDKSIYMVELKENPKIWRIAHTHSIYDPSVGKDYWAEAFASITKDGKRVYWGSNWDIPGKEARLEVYRADLPPDWYTVLNSK